MILSMRCASSMTGPDRAPCLRCRCPTRLPGNSGYSATNGIYHFTPETVRMGLAKGGWEVTQIHFQRVLSDPIASLGHILRDKGFEHLARRLIDVPQHPGIERFFLYPLAWLASVFGQTGRMTIWAKRAD